MPRRRPLLHALLLAGLLVTAGSPRTLSGQTVTGDSLPFRRGQWGAQFTLTDDLVGLGALRFRSPTSAWLLDASGNFGRIDTSTEGHSTSSTVGVRAGLRSYRPLVPRVARYHGAGLIATYARSATTRPFSAADFSSWLAGGGVYAELGAAYFLVPHLSLGATATATVLAERGRQQNNDPVVGVASSSMTRWFVSAGGLRVLGTLYF